MIVPPNRKDLSRYIIPMLGLYPARGCPFLCNFCSVIKIAGRRIRSQSITTTLASLRGQGGWCGGDHVHLGQLQQVSRGRGAPDGHGGRATRAAALRPVRHADRQAGAPGGAAGQGRLLPDVRRRRIVQPPDPAGRREGAEPSGDVPRHRASVPRHGISSHFSNIIGFPQDTEQAVHEHLETLRALDPTLASFYILCPIPGTEQYDDFLARG